MVAGGTASTGIALPTITLPEGELVIRVHAKSRGPVFFGPAPGKAPGNRFDAPSAEFRVFYGSLRLEGAYAEAVLRKPSGRILTRAYVNQRAWSTLRLERAVVLAKLYDEGMQPYEVDAGQLAADDYAFCRKLALKLHKDHPGLDGLAYKSKYHNGELCYALFDRVQSTDLTTLRTDRFEDHDDRVDELMTYYRAAFDTSAPVPATPPR